jgi:hypothetical protein
MGKGAMDLALRIAHFDRAALRWRRPSKRTSSRGSPCSSPSAARGSRSPAWSGLRAYVGVCAQAARRANGGPSRRSSPAPPYGIGT